MESAKMSPVTPDIRLAQPDDAAAITQLMRHAAYLHLHADWRLPVEWLSRPVFAVRQVRDRLTGCLAISADPPPAAWVRVAALTATAPAEQLAALLERVWPQLAAAGIREVAWLTMASWPETFLDQLPVTFRQLKSVDSYIKHDVGWPAGLALPPVDIRPVRPAQFAALAALEVDTYAPLWRHSAGALAAANRQSLSFDVAWWDDRPVGFQYSTRGQSGAHLARITVAADRQGQGVGTALLVHALNGYRAHGLRTVTLNTQSDNLAAQAFYRRFGFEPAGLRVPVWSATVENDQGVPE